MNKKKFLPTFRFIGSYLIRCILILLMAALLPCNPANAVSKNVDVETIEPAQIKQEILKLTNIETNLCYAAA